MSKKPAFRDEIDSLILQPFEALSWANPETGETLSGMELVEYSYTREGRRLFGHELPNPTPIDPPIGFVPHEPVHEQIKRMVLRELAAQQGLDENDTLEEMDDFETDDPEDFDPLSPWEEQFWPETQWPPSAESAGPAPDSPSAPMATSSAAPAPAAEPSEE